MKYTSMRGPKNCFNYHSSEVGVFTWEIVQFSGAVRAVVRRDGFVRVCAVGLVRISAVGGVGIVP